MQGLSKHTDELPHVQLVSWLALFVWEKYIYNPHDDVGNLPPLTGSHLILPPHFSRHPVSKRQRGRTPSLRVPRRVQPAPADNGPKKDIPRPASRRESRAATFTSQSTTAIRVNSLHSRCWPPLAQCPFRASSSFSAIPVCSLSAPLPQQLPRSSPTSQRSPPSTPACLDLAPRKPLRSSTRCLIRGA